jgi:hypothetical protein
VPVSQAKKQVSKSARSGAMLEAFVAQSKSKLDDVEAKLGTEAPQLTADDKRRTAKLRKGGDRIVEHLGVVLASARIDAAGLSVDQMLSDLERAQTLEELQRRIDSLSKRVSDEVFAARASSWSTAMAGYAVLQRMANNNGEIAAQIEPVATFFAYRTPAVLAKRTPVHVRKAQADVRKAQARIDAQVAQAKATLEKLKPSTPNIEVGVVTPIAPTTASAAPTTMTGRAPVVPIPP